jgi:hypothetical protein
MKNILKVFTICFALISMGMLSPAEAQSRKDKKTQGNGNIKFTLSQTNHDFGTVRRGEFPTHQISITNESSFPIKIADFERACGVTISAFTKDVIEPGDTGEFTLSLNSNGMNGVYSKDMRIVVVNANNPQERTEEHIGLKVKVIRPATGS